MIQGIINRMAENSFMLKGWAVTLIAGIFALASKDSDKLYFLVAYIPIVIFWGLDSFYLLQERLYRYLYDNVRKKSEEEIDFSMKPTIEEIKNRCKYKWINCLFSKTEMLFYFPLAIVCAGVIIITHV